jgi:uncharacterized protein involved in exopolysaccharide biosynthesis
VDDVKYIAHMFEEIRSQNKAVLEAVGDMQKKVAVLPRIEQRLEALEQDMQVVKAAVTATNRDVIGLDHRVSRLGTA